MRPGNPDRVMHIHDSAEQKQVLYRIQAYLTAMEPKTGMAMIRNRPLCPSRSSRICIRPVLGEGTWFLPIVVRMSRCLRIR
jgi:hypothetical protein